MIHVELRVGSRYRVDRNRLRECIISVLRQQQLDNVQVGVWVVGTRKIKELNETLLHHQGITDVLSFPLSNSLSDSPFPFPSEVLQPLGDIVVCFPVAVDAAKRLGKRVDDQLCFFAEHGLMHVLGYHHEDN